MLTLEKMKAELEKLRKEYDDTMRNNEFFTPAQSANMTELVGRIKQLEDDIKKVELWPLTLQVEKLDRLATEEEIADAKVAIREFEKNVLPKFLEAFYPNLLENPVAYEMQRQEALKLLSRLDTEGLTAVTDIINSMRSEITLGERTDFVSLLLFGVEGYFKEQNIHTGNVFWEFDRVKFDYLGRYDRESLLQQFRDYKKARKIFINFLYERKEQAGA